MEVIIVLHNNGISIISLASLEMSNFLELFYAWKCNLRKVSDRSFLEFWTEFLVDPNFQNFLDLRFFLF